MKSFCTVILILILSACGTESNNPQDEAILTSTSWALTSENEEMLLTFHNDGSFEEGFGPFKMMGQWAWISKDEVVRQYARMSYNGKIDNLTVKKDDKIIIRITEVSNERLVGIQRHFLDAEDSGFARPISYRSVD
ncbi:MAG: hypothetical protein L0Y35_06995 [Flammeovirgaceae bacterium]|nr:hypothetical protein [Flammeovirgaceae bacterium]